MDEDEKGCLIFIGLLISGGIGYYIGISDYNIAVARAPQWVCGAMAAFIAICIYGFFLVMIKKFFE